MQTLTKFGALENDRWQVLDKDQPLQDSHLQEGFWLLHAKIWLAAADRLTGREDIGLWLDSDDALEPLAEQLHRLPLIAVNFPVFTDGRAFSHARSLRDRYGFGGELRAIGHFMQDQLFYLKRCGLDSFQVGEGANIASMADSLKDFSDFYQAACDQPLPLFRRRNA